MHSTKSWVLVVASIFIVVELMSGAVYLRPTFALPTYTQPPDHCFHDGCPGTSCRFFSPYYPPNYYGPKEGYTRCNWFDVNKFQWTQTCVTDPSSKPIGNQCDLATKTGAMVPPQPPVISQPPTNLAPPPSCPDGSAPDANGVCPPTTQGSTTTPTDQGTTKPLGPPANLIPQSCPDGSIPDANGNCPAVNQGTIQSSSPPPPAVDNTPTKHHKGGSDLSQSPALSGSGDNNNNDNTGNKPSKHHKGGNDSPTPAS